MYVDWCCSWYYGESITPMFPKSAVAFLPACAAVLPSAMAAPAAPLPSDVHFAATVAGILACNKWNWRSILGIPANDENPNYASSYRKLNLLIHPDKRTGRGIELAGGTVNCDLAFQIVRQAYELATEVLKTVAPMPCSPKPSPSSPNQYWHREPLQPSRGL